MSDPITCSFTINSSEKERALITEIAQQKRMSRSAFVMKIVMDYINKLEKK